MSAVAPTVATRRREPGQFLLTIFRGCRELPGNRVAFSLSIACSKCSTLGNRSVGLRARHRRMELSQLVSRSGTCTRGDGGASFSRLNATARPDSPVKGSVPVTISYSTMPRA